MKKTIWYILVIAITLTTLIIVWQFSLSIVLFALSLAVSAAMKPLINWVAGKGRSRHFAMGLVYSVGIVSILVLLGVTGQLMLQDLQNATNDFVINYDRVKTEWPKQGSVFQQTISEQLPSSDDLYQALISEEGMVTLTKDSGSGQGFFSSLGYIAIILSLSIYWSADQLRFERISISLFPADHRAKALHIWRAVENGVGAYLRSELIQSALAGLLLGLGYWIIGIRYPTLLAFWGAIVRLVPWFGILIAVIPLFFLGGGLSLSAILSVLYTIVVLFTLRVTIEARFLDQQRNNPLLMVLFVIILAEAFGWIGVLLAPPLAVAVQILLQELYPLFPRRYFKELKVAFGLKKRLSRLRIQLKNSNHPVSRQLLNQLNQLVKQTISYIQNY